MDAVPVKKTSGKKMPLNIGKEKARRQEDEKETLLARIGTSSVELADGSRTRESSCRSHPT